MTPSCIAGALIQNFAGDDDKQVMTALVHIAAVAAVKRLAPAVIPGPGWLYVSVAVVYDAFNVGKSYLDCMKK